MTFILPLSGSSHGPDHLLSPLVEPDETPPYRVVNPGATTPLVLVCDHAGRAIPRKLNQLGLQEKDLSRHIAWDIGAEDLTVRIAQMLSATAVLATWSRLVIDVNRAPGHPDSIPEYSDGTIIPGNFGLGLHDRQQRVDTIHGPYHRAIDAELARLRRAGSEPVLFSVHTFTPEMNGERRIWDVGVLWNRDSRLSAPLIRALRNARPALVVGDNEPYSGRDIAYTLNLHGGRWGAVHAAVEVRQDHCETQAGTSRYAELLAEALCDVLACGSAGVVPLSCGGTLHPLPSPTILSLNET